MNNQFDYSYLTFNSLYKNKQTLQQNVLQFSVVEQSNSTVGQTGVSKQPSQIVQIKSGPITLSRKFYQSQSTALSDTYFGKLFVLIRELISSSYSSHQGFRYHFEYALTEDPNDPTQLIATPVQDTFNLCNQYQFNDNLSFEFYTYKPYNLEQDEYECYIDYSQPYLTLRKVDGTNHNLTNLDIVYLNNFSVPGIYNEQNVNTETFKQNYYRVTNVDNQNFQLPIQLPSNIVNSINRPADQSLGIYQPNISMKASPGLVTIITSPIPHGLTNNSYINITNTNLPQTNSIIQAWQVTVINDTQFTINYDSSFIPQLFTIVVESLPISTDRKNTIIVKIVTKKTELSIRIASVSDTANNNIAIVD